MSRLLQVGGSVQFQFSGLEGRVDSFLGGGGQGEVYQVSIEGKPWALKWYFPHTATEEQRRGLEILIRRGAPNDRFLWPVDLATSSKAGFGYLMPLRDPAFTGMADLLRGKVAANLFNCTTIGLQLADSFFQLHAMGFCYKDISYNNVFFCSKTGNVLVCDNDNIGIDGGRTSIKGTPSFMAPEIVRNEKMPSTSTDLYSLAVLLFYIFVRAHPLEGKKESEIPIFDPDASRKLYGFEPTFIFDPDDNSNRPIPGVPNHDNALQCWSIYPGYFQELFERSFTAGIRDPVHGRVRETEWRAAIIQLRDLIVYCGNCGVENIHDPEASKKNIRCWRCGKPVVTPSQIKIGKNLVMLNYNTQLFPHHTDLDHLYDVSEPAAEVVRHPKDPRIWGLKNLTEIAWTATMPGGRTEVIEPGKSVTLKHGTRVNFGTKIGVIH